MPRGTSTSEIRRLWNQTHNLLISKQQLYSQSHSCNSAAAVGSKSLIYFFPLFAVCKEPILHWIFALQKHYLHFCAVFCLRWNKKLLCSRRWRPDSRHRRWPLEPSNREYQWTCSFDQSSCPTEPRLQSQLENENMRNDHEKTLILPGWYSASRCVLLPSLTSAFSVSKTFWPFMSRWITWWEWRWERPWKTNTSTMSAPVRGRVRWLASMKVANTGRQRAASSHACIHTDPDCQICGATVNIFAVRNIHYASFNKLV